MPAKKTTRRPAAKTTRRPAAKKRLAPRRPVKAAPRKVVYSRKPVATRRQVKAAPRKYARKLASARVMAPAAVLEAVKSRVITPAVGASILAAQGSPMYGPKMRSPSYVSPSKSQHFPLYGPAMAPGSSPKAMASLFQQPIGPRVVTPFAQKIANAAAARGAYVSPKKSAAVGKYGSVSDFLGRVKTGLTPKAADAIVKLVNQGTVAPAAIPAITKVAEEAPKAAQVSVIKQLAARVSTGTTPALHAMISKINRQYSSPSKANNDADWDVPTPGRSAKPVKHNSPVPQMSSSQQSTLAKKLDAEGPVSDKAEAIIEQTSTSNKEAEIKKAIVESVPPGKQQEDLAKAISEIQASNSTVWEKIKNKVGAHKHMAYAVGAGALILAAYTLAPEGTGEQIVHQMKELAGPDVSAAIATYTTSVVTALKSGVSMAGDGVAQVTGYISSGLSQVANSATAAAVPWWNWAVSQLSGAVTQAGGRRRRRGRRVLRGGRRPANARRNWY